MHLTLRGQRQVTANEGEAERWEETITEVYWEPAKTAIIVCDMWNKHWCASATRRVDELAPVMERVLQAARAQGVLIVHAPSDTIPVYADTPARLRAQNAPTAPAPDDIQKWQRLDLNCEAPLPIDDSDAGCDDEIICSHEPPYPWTAQHPAITIDDRDAISQDGAEIHNLFAQYDIQNVLIMGVHTNMCVLGRPFGIRRMVRQGRNVALMRDMTDAMYNPRRSPYVSHFQGTKLVISHIERYWCPTLTSDQFIGGSPFRFQKDLPDK